MRHRLWRRREVPLDRIRSTSHGAGFVHATFPGSPTFKSVRGYVQLRTPDEGQGHDSGHAVLGGRSVREGVKRMIQRTAIEYRAESRILVLSAERLTNRADSEAQYLAASAAARMANLLERGFSMEQAQALAMGEDVQS